MEIILRQIAVSGDTREFLMKAFKVTSVMVWKSLNYKSNSDLAKRIRKLALERGGVELVTCPVGKAAKECVETMHDSDGYIRQYFPNGAMVEFSKDDGMANVYFKGEVMLTYLDVKLTDVEVIQQDAMDLV